MPGKQNNFITASLFLLQACQGLLHLMHPGMGFLGKSLCLVFFAKLEQETSEVDDAICSVRVLVAKYFAASFIGLEQK